jgi:hypothetical protein
MITVEYIAKKLSEQFPGHNFVISDRVSYKVIQVDGFTELRLPNEVLIDRSADDLVWLKSLADAVGEAFPKKMVAEEPIVPVTQYVEQMEKDKNEPSEPMDSTTVVKEKVSK